MKKQMALHKTKKQTYFEGWYYRIKYMNKSIAIIIGITKNYAFIEMFDDNYHCSYQRYSLDEFYQDNDCFHLGDNTFNEESINIVDVRLSFQIKVSITNHVCLKQTKYRPTIMGPFSYLKNMECNHAIICMNARSEGEIVKKNKVYNIDGLAYIEKDWGSSFPKEYTWFQANDIKDSIFGAVATIPFCGIHFCGIILAIKNEEIEYVFASYLGARVIFKEKIDNYCFLEIKQGNKIVSMKIEKNKGCVLPAPKLGKMNQLIEESIDTSIDIMIRTNKKLLYRKEFEFSGFENRNFFK